MPDVEPVKKVCPRCKGDRIIKVLCGGGDYENWPCPECRPGDYERHSNSYFGHSGYDGEAD